MEGVGKRIDLGTECCYIGAPPLVLQGGHSLEALDVLLGMLLS